MLQTENREVVRVDESAQCSPCVLLVQSDAELRKAMVQACEHEGLHVYGCATIALAQEACRRCEMDLIVVDWVMEGLFADDLLRLFETALHPRGLPTTLVLSRMGEADTRDCLRPDTPVHGVLTRPTNAREFVAWAPPFAAVVKRCQRPRERTPICMTA